MWRVGFSLIESRTSSGRAYATGGLAGCLRRTVTEWSRHGAVPGRGFTGRRGPGEPRETAGAGSGRGAAQKNYESGSSLGPVGNPGVLGADDNRVRRETVRRQLLGAARESAAVGRIPRRGAVESKDPGSGSADCRSADAHRARKSVDACGGRHGTVRYPGEPLSVGSDGTPGAHAGDAGPAAAKTFDDARRGPAHGHGTVATLATIQNQWVKSRRHTQPRAILVCCLPDTC